MKYQANPVIVTAQTITCVNLPDESGYTPLTLDNGETFLADSGMTARYHPQAGDYVVTQSDGYVYLNPKEVFERKYSPYQEPQAEQAA